MRDPDVLSVAERDAMLGHEQGTSQLHLPRRVETADETGYAYCPSLLVYGAAPVGRRARKLSPAFASWPR